MPQKEISPTTRSVLTLINNAHDLIVYSNKRKEAKDVVRALKAFARQELLSLPEEKIENFLCCLLDSRPNTLSYLLIDIAKTVVEKQ